MLLTKQITIKMSKNQQNNIGFVRASITPKSFDKANKSFDVVFATETPVLRSNWDGSFNEILRCSPDSVRSARMDNGLPLYDNHPWDKSATGTMEKPGVLGQVRNCHFENKQLVGTVVLGARADIALLQDIENGIVNTVSVGYNVYKFERQPDVEGQDIPTYCATDWEPMEVSLAPVPADINSQIRSFYNNNQNPNMERTIESIRKESNVNIDRLDSLIALAREHKFDDAKVIELYDSKRSVLEITADLKKPAPAPANVEEIRAGATKEQNDRLNAILTSTRKAGIDDKDAIEWHLSGKSIEEIRAEIIDKFVAKQPGAVSSVHVGATSEEKRNEACEQALMFRCSPSSLTKEQREWLQGNPFVGRSLLSISEMLLQDKGVNTRSMNAEKIVDAIFKRDASTSDMPLILSNLVNKLLRQDYEFIEEQWSKLSVETTVPNFKPKNFYQFDTANGMNEIPEGDELKYGKMFESKQTLSIKSYGEGLILTRKAMYNDDLSAFEKIPQRFALDWNTMQGDMVWALITSNTVMEDDNKPLFHSAHGNYTSTGTALSKDSLAAALTLMRRQYGVGGKRRIRIQPKHLVVPPELESVAFELLKGVIVATKFSDANMFTGLDMDYIVEPRLTDPKAWYLAADPAKVDGIKHAYLDGQAGLRSARVEDFDKDGIKFGVRGEFGANIIDYRGWYKNAGA